MPKIENINIAELRPLPPPSVIKGKIAMSEPCADAVLRGRREVEQILGGKDRRLLVVVGPCSIHDPDAALDYARKLRGVAKEIDRQIVVIMRVYFEKPRTTTGWKGLINDPYLDGTCDVEAGLRVARELLVEITAMGLPTATEFLDPIIPQYLADLVSWAAIGARTTESQTHRELASGLSMPVGFKNGTDGSLQTAINAMLAARTPHSFLGIDSKGATCIVRTKGNPWGHVVLRGGRDGSNYDEASLKHSAELLRAAKLPSALMIDCSHANSGKKFERQEKVWREVIDQRLHGNRDIIGLMVESNLVEGNQPLAALEKLNYGVSITDPCLGWETTERLLQSTADRLERDGRRASA